MTLDCLFRSPAAKAQFKKFGTPAKQSTSENSKITASPAVTTTPKKPAVNTFPINVFLRLRPIKPEQKRVITAIDSQTVICVNRTDPTGALEGDKYKFDHVFDFYTNQEEIFEKTAKPLVENLFEGQSSLIFAYGVTNAGKTFTMMGKQPEQIQQEVKNLMRNKKRGIKRAQQAKPAFKGIDQNDGIIPRALDKIFTLIEEKKKTDGGSYIVDVSYLEIYNETIYDLFVAEDEQVEGEVRASKVIEPQRKEKLQITEEAGRNVVRGLRQICVASADEACQLLYEGNKNRQVSTTLLNKDSSRSHALFTIRVLEKEADLNMSDSDDEDDDEEDVDDDSIEQRYKPLAYMSIVDLAGVERAGRTQTTGDRLKEASAINLSLTVLGKCMETLRQNQKLAQTKQQVVPFRESKLTRLIQDVMCRGRVNMIANVNPASEDLDENLNVLKYATIAKEVNTGTKVDTWRSPYHTTKTYVNPRLIQSPSYAKISTTPSAIATSTLSLSEKQLYEQQLQAMNHKYEELKREFVRTTCEMESKLREEAANEMSKHFTEMEVSFKRKSQHDALNLETNYEKKILNLKHTIQQYKRKATYLENRLNELRDKYSSDKEIIDEQAKKEIENKVKGELEEQRQEMIDLLKQEHQLALKKLELEYRDKIDTLQASLRDAKKHSEELEIVKKKYKSLEESFKQTNQELEELETKYREEKEFSMSQLDALDAEKNEFIAKMNEELEKQNAVIEDKDRLLETMHREFEVSQKDYLQAVDKVNLLEQTVESQNQQIEELKAQIAQMGTKEKKGWSILSPLKGLKNLKSPFKKLVSPDKRGKKRTSDAIKQPVFEEEDLQVAEEPVPVEQSPKRRRTSKVEEPEQKVMSPTAYVQQPAVEEVIEVEEEPKPVSKTVVRSRNKKSKRKKKLSTENNKENASASALNKVSSPIQVLSPVKISSPAKPSTPKDQTPPKKMQKMMSEDDASPQKPAEKEPTKKKRRVRLLK